jgi:hypothetical protein
MGLLYINNRLSLCTAMSLNVNMFVLCQDSNSELGDSSIRLSFFEMTAHLTKLYVPLAFA